MRACPCACSTRKMLHSITCSVLCLLVLLTGASAADRSLKVIIDPIHPPVTKRFDERLALHSSDIISSDPRVQKKGKACEQPEQVHLTYWSSSSVLVSWASCDAQLKHTQPVATDSIRSVVHYGTSKDSLHHTAEGVTTSYVNEYTGNGTSYASPLLHHVLLKGLQPGAAYHYKVADSSGATDGAAKLLHGLQSGKIHKFTLPKPATFPLKIGVLGDPGQTYNTSETLSRLIHSQPQLVLLLGDFAYADNWLAEDTPIPDGQWGTATYQPKWDTWGRLFEPLLSHVPLLHTNGNHEIEPLANGDRDTSYNHRYPTPQLTGHDYNAGPSTFAPVSAKAPFANLYYTVDVPGVVKYIALTSYAPGQTFSTDEAQYIWLERELRKVVRSHTPWVVVAVHAPWYHTYAGHFKEVECMRQAYEPLMVQYQVDLVISGHVHAYERTRPVVNYQLSECGPMYLTVGDGGNIEGIYADYIDDIPLIDPKTGNATHCADPERFTRKLFSPKYQPQACFSWQDGRFCPSQQPEWSAYREPSFGYGMLDIVSPTTAKWRWFKNQWPAWRVGDEVTIMRGGSAGCSQKQQQKQQQQHQRQHEEQGQQQEEEMQQQAHQEQQQQERQEQDQEQERHEQQQEPLQQQSQQEQDQEQQQQQEQQQEPLLQQQQQEQQQQHAGAQQHEPRLQEVY